MTGQERVPEHRRDAEGGEYWRLPHDATVVLVRQRGGRWGLHRERAGVDKLIAALARSTDPNEQRLHAALTYGRPTAKLAAAASAAASAGESAPPRFGPRRRGWMTGTNWSWSHRPSADWCNRPSTRPVRMSWNSLESVGAL